MKIKNGFIMREVAKQTVVLPSGGDLDLNMMITLNGTGKFLWEQLEKGAEIEDLVSALLSEYEVDEQTARQSVVNFVEKLKANGILE